MSKQSGPNRSHRTQAKEWVSLHLKAKLKEHGGKLMHKAGVQVTLADRKLQRCVISQGVDMRASDVAWAWVAQQVREGRVAPGQRVFRPEIGKLALTDEQVLWSEAGGAGDDRMGRRSQGTDQQEDASEGGALQASAEEHFQGAGKGSGGQPGADDGGGVGHGSGASRDDTRAGCGGMEEHEQAGRAGGGRQSGEAEVLV